MQRAQNQNTSTTRTESQDRSTLPGGQGSAQVLRLRGEPGEPEAPTTQRRRIRWAEDVVDNEGQGKKSSKVCCIFHKARPVGESSSESESESDESDSSSDESDTGSGARKAGSGHHHDDGNSCKGKGHKRQRSKRKFVPNAYERMPSNRTGNNSNQPS